MEINRFTESHCKEQLLPFTLTRHSAEIRIGMFTIKEKWERAIEIFPTLNIPQRIPANLIPGFDFFALLAENPFDEVVAKTELYKSLIHPWQITQFNEWALRQDISMATHQNKSASISDTIKTTGEDLIFFESNVTAEHCYINTSHGPVYISSDALIMEGAMLRGPLFIGKGSIIKMGTAIYGATTIGPNCIVGGEIKNSVLFGNSNKAHEGYLGDSVIGEWCNLGAGTTCSNIRNNATAVKVWDMKKKMFVEAGLKCGLLMGDYSRASIHSTFNTGTVVGISANIFQAGGLLPKYIPSFSWGPAAEIRYNLDKAISDINNWMSFKNQALSNDQIIILQHIFSFNENA